MWWLFAVAAAQPALLSDLGSGSLCGGSVLRLHVPGSGHVAKDLRVQLGLAPCEFTAPPVCVEANATNATVIPGGCDVTCVTTTLASADTTKVYVTAYEGQKPPVQLGTFLYTTAKTPVVTDFGPNAGQGGDMLHLVGTGLDGAQVSIGGSSLTKRFGGPLLVQAVVDGPLPAGNLPVRVRTPSGDACTTAGAPPLSFRAIVNVQSLQGKRRGSMGGGGDLVIVGQGLAGAQAMLCGAPCNVTQLAPEPRELHAGEAFQALHCAPAAFAHEPKAAALPVSSGVTCDLRVHVGDQAALFPAAWTYAPELTPAIRGVSAVGTVVTVNGMGFDDDATVSVGHAPCGVTKRREDYIECSLVAPHEGVVKVVVNGKGNAVPMYPNADLLLFPTPPPHIPVDTISAFTSTLCKQTTLSTDCPVGWSCCPVRGLAVGVGRCAATCTRGSFLSKALQAALTPPPPR